MDASPFGTLSGEMRNRIYEYFFNSQLATQTQVDVRDKQPRLKRNQNKTRNALALTATSRQLRRETLAIFWSTASFRVVADTLTAYSQPVDSIPDVHPMNRAHDINEDRADCLKEWLGRSGIANFAPILRPMELDLGMWDPRIHADTHQFIVLRLLKGDTQALTSQLQSLQAKAKLSTEGTAPRACTLLFKVQVQPSTALGSIRVPNERSQALAAIANLCEGRRADVQDRFRSGLLTPHGHYVLSSDVAMCRSVAEQLVGFIVDDENDIYEKAEIVRKRRAKAQKVQASKVNKKGNHNGQ